MVGLPSSAHRFGASRIQLQDGFLGRFGMSGVGDGTGEP